MSRGWLLLFGLIGASLIPLVLGGSDMFSRLRAFPLDSLLLMFGMIVVCWFINGLRLRLLLAGRAGNCRASASSWPASSPSAPLRAAAAGR